LILAASERAALRAELRTVAPVLRRVAVGALACAGVALVASARRDLDPAVRTVGLALAGVGACLSAVAIVRRTRYRAQWMARRAEARRDDA
jgi:hypothetical protein